MVTLRDTDSPEVQLRQIRDILRHYCQGLTAKDVQVNSTKELTEKGIGWTSVEKPATEGTSIYLPSTVDEFTSTDHNFAHYKVLATHQSAHLEFGTFDFSFDKDSSLFANARPEIGDRLPSNGDSLSDFQRFFDLFSDRILASDVFMVIEDTRIDYLLKHEYRGIRSAYDRAQHNALRKRPDINLLPMREALIEILIQFSIENWGFYAVPPGQSNKLAMAISILRRVRSRRATVEDSAEATIRIYNLLRSTQNVEHEKRDAENSDSVNPSDGVLAPPDDLESIISDFLNQSDNGSSTGSSGNSRSERPYQSPREVDYRGGIKPELVQTLKRLRQTKHPDAGEDASVPSSQALQRMVDQSVEIEPKDASHNFVLSSQSFLQNLMRERGKIGSQFRQPEQSPTFQAVGPSRPKLNSPARENSVILYDEWDYLANAYRRRWCLLRQRLIEEGSPEFYNRTVKNYSSLVATVRREFERLRSERFKRVRPLQDGEEFDFDSVIEAVVQKRVGAPPSDKLYWRRNKIERDVCVALLLDMSASTYESVSGGYRLNTSGDPNAEKPKRIIDVEKESIVVLVEALEAIGDAYGIYGFSGHGKENVDFYIVKDLSEDMSTKVKKRIEKIAPAQETRMGTAIRHAINLLDERESKTKVLLLVSDGRPQDHDYGSHHFREASGLNMAIGDSPPAFVDHSYDRLMKEYAVCDTSMALLEAKQRNIIPFCLTVDKRGHDYLKSMCGDIGYEVLDDITALPKRLPSLYRHLTT